MKSLATTTILPSALLAALTLLVPLTTVSANPVLVGIVDDFQNGPEPLSPSPELEASLVGFGGCQDLDLVAGVGAGINNRQVAHTFTDLPNGIVRAWLETKVRAGDDPGVGSDGIFLSVVDEDTRFYSDALVWRRSFGPAPATPPYYPVDDPGLFGSWNAGDEATLVLELHAIPRPDGSFDNITRFLSRRGFLDVNVSDETGVDFYRLTWEIGATDVPQIGSAVAGAGPGEVRCFPNPCRGAAAISFVAPDVVGVDGPSRWSVFDVTGRQIRTFDRDASGGHPQRLDWATVDATGRSLAPGTYFVRFESAARTGSAKFVVVR